VGDRLAGENGAISLLGVFSREEAIDGRLDDREMRLNCGRKVRQH